MVKLNKSTAVAIMLSIDTAQLLVPNMNRVFCMMLITGSQKICELWLELVGHVVLPAGLFN